MFFNGTDSEITTDYSGRNQHATKFGNISAGQDDGNYALFGSDNARILVPNVTDNITTRAGFTIGLQIWLDLESTPDPCSIFELRDPTTSQYLLRMYISGQIIRLDARCGTIAGYPLSTFGNFIFIL
jgi:hypothetical protein